MPAKAVVDAVEARIGPVWNGVPVMGVNLSSDAPDDASAFIVLQYFTVAGRRLVLGREFAEDGAIRIVVNGPRGDGMGQLLEWQDQLASLFRAKTFGGVETGVPDLSPLDDDNDLGSYYQIRVIVPYSYQFSEEEEP